MKQKDVTYNWIDYEDLELHGKSIPFHVSIKIVN